MEVTVPTMNPEKLLVNRQENEPRFDPWKLRVWREARGLTGKQLAEQAGYGPNAMKEISSMERYIAAVGPVTQERLAQALGIEVDALISTGETFRANRAKYDAWVADGRPSLGKWLKGRSV